MRGIALSGLLAGSFLAACSAGGSDGASSVEVVLSASPSARPVAPSASGTGAAAVTSTAATATGPEGRWRSASCGERKYARELTLGQGGQLAARDLVAPCPPAVACVWSGIVDRKGTWSTSGSTIQLTLAPDTKPSPDGSALPPALGFADGVLSETSASGERCVYARL